MNPSLDRLYKLLPTVYRDRDADQGFPLEALLQVISEQVNVVDADIAQLYENWFIETCEDWVVPYLGDLLGYQSVHEAGEPGDVTTTQGQQRNKILIPRRDVANTIRYRRRKGTLALLELLANDVAGWPARAVEFYTLLSWMQNLRQADRSPHTIDLRQGHWLEELNGPFDRAAHAIDLRRINSTRSVGLYNVANVGVYVWRLATYSVTQTPTYCQESAGSNCYTFSVLGNDSPLYTLPQPETDPTHIAEKLNLPVPIRRRDLHRDLKSHKAKDPEFQQTDYYGIGKSLQIWRGSPRELIPAKEIVVANLSRWHYRPPAGKVAVDPELGRIVFPPGHLPKKGVWVSYHYGFSAAIGGGEYDRPLIQPLKYALYQVGKNTPLSSINAALEQWQADQQNQILPTDSSAHCDQQPDYHHAVIEIIDSEVYVEPINITLQQHQSLQLRAANGKRPVIRLLDWHTDLPDGLTVNGEKGSRFTLDGIMIAGRGVQIEGELFEIAIRHSTLVPGWGLHCDCEPQRSAEPSLELIKTTARVKIEHSILGSIEVYQDEAHMDPVPISISDSILDATSPEREALSGPGCSLASATLTILRSTVLGKVHTHAIELGENCLFNGQVKVARRQQGCIRFSYVPANSRTPRRYHCQPDLVEQAVAERVAEGKLPPDKQAETQAFERDRVRPQFNSTRYGTPTYCQLAATCAEEITRGADDESEMGVFHDLFQPQRAANLRARLNEYTPAGVNVGILYAN